LFAVLAKKCEVSDVATFNLQLNLGWEAAYNRQQAA